MAAGCDLGANRHILDVPAASVVTGDLDGDGVLDLVSAGDDAIAVHLGDGEGGFTTTTYDYEDPYGDHAYVEVALVDADSDGDLDVVSAQRYERGGSDTLHLHLNDGIGGLTRDAAFGGFGFVTDMAVGDTDDDGRDDVVTTAEYGTQIHVSTGSGSFDTVDLPGGGSSVDVADINGDGRDDVVVGSGPLEPAVGVTVHLAGATGWEPAVTFPVGDGLLRLTAVRAADLDGDGGLDLVVGGPTSARRTAYVSVLLGEGDGTFGPARLAEDRSRPGVVDLETADIDGDGLTDIVMAEDEYGGAAVLCGAGAGGGADAHGLVVSTLEGVPSDTSDVAVGDVLGDDAPEVAAAGSLLDVFPNALDGARTHD